MHDPFSDDSTRSVFTFTENSNQLPSPSEFTRIFCSTTQSCHIKRRQPTEELNNFIRPSKQVEVDGDDNDDGARSNSIKQETRIKMMLLSN